VIDHLNNLLRHLFIRDIGDITSEAQVRFRPPDDDWRSEVVNLNAPALNVYLMELRENRKLRSNASARVGEVDGQVILQQAPARIDCQYFVTAWHPANAGPAVESTVDEHILLYQVVAVLMQNMPLNPSRIYTEGSVAWLSTPPPIRAADLPTQVLPVEGFPKLAEFWGTMGPNHRWKPGVLVTVTLPVVYAPQPGGPLVTTRVIEYRQRESMETVYLRYQIAGHVLDATGATPAPVKAAWVRLETLTGDAIATTVTNELGQFSIYDVHPGRYRFRWRAGQRQEPPVREVEVPSPTGEYDLIFA
jgi:hypothetical protein